MTDKKKVFLGGTCNNSTWREYLIPLLKIDYYNPVVPNWTPECQAEEIKQRTECDYVLYTITPEMTGFYSIAEVVDDSNKRPEKTLFCVLFGEDGFRFTSHQEKSIKATMELVRNNGAQVYNNLEYVADVLNGKEVYNL